MNPRLVRHAACAAAGALLLAAGASAPGERVPRVCFGRNVERPSPAAAMNGVVPSSVVKL